MVAPAPNAGLFAALGRGSISNYEPSWRDNVAYWLAQNWYGDNREGVQKANRLLNVADVTPAGVPFALDDAARSLNRGDYVGGGVTLAMAGIPAVRKEAKLTGEAAKEVLGNILEKHGLAPKTIRAYHGSPHSFDKFDMSKIGTGEGAQAYGHGLYFAENEGVAQNYRDQLAKSQIDFGGNRMQPAEVSDLLWKQSGNDSPEFLRGVMDAVHEMTATGKAPTPPADLSGWMGYGPMAQKEGYAYAANQLSKAKASSGSMYEVQINADPEQFLDWDKPLSEQPERVRKALIDKLPSTDKKTPLKDVVNLWESSGLDTSRMSEMKMSGQDIYHFAPGKHETLKQAGIPGIKYLDQGSRARGDGSRNYVVFDDRLITILRKYGLLPPIAGAAAYGATQDQQTAY